MGMVKNFCRGDARDIRIREYAVGSFRLSCDDNFAKKIGLLGVWTLGQLLETPISHGI